MVQEDQRHNVGNTLGPLPCLRVTRTLVLDHQLACHYHVFDGHGSDDYPQDLETRYHVLQCGGGYRGNLDYTRLQCCSRK